MAYNAVCPVCNYLCSGPKGLRIHFLKKHPEYKFHFNKNKDDHKHNGRMKCDVCGKRIESYSILAALHNHNEKENNEKIPVISENQSREWIETNYKKVAEFYIDNNGEKRLTMKQFDIGIYALSRCLYLAGFSEDIYSSFRKGFDKQYKNKVAVKINGKQENKMPDCLQENLPTANATDGIQADKIIEALEYIINENRSLKKEKSLWVNRDINFAKESAELRSKIEDLNKSLELCQIDKRRAEDALRKRILEAQRPLAIKIEDNYIKQAME